MMSSFYTRFAFLAFVLTASPALAASPTSLVGSPAVDAHAASIEVRSGFTTDDDASDNHQRYRLRQHLDYGFNDWYALRLITSQDKRPGDAFEHEAITIENRFELVESRLHGWDAGIRLKYAQSDGDKTPHELEVIFLALFPLPLDWEYRANFAVEHDIGENSEPGLLLEYRHQLTKRFTFNESTVTALKLGLESFHDFGHFKDRSSFDYQDHQVGPVANVSFDNGFFLQTGYRTGISDSAADHLFKLAVGQKF